MAQTILKGTLLDEGVELSLEDVSVACSCSREWVVELVEEGVLEPHGSSRRNWRFSGASLVRAQTAMRLQRDFEIDVAGVALALELIDEIRILRERLQRLESAGGDGG